MYIILEELNLNDYFGDNKEFSQLYISSLESLDSLYYRNKIYYEILYLWLDNRNNNRNIANYFNVRNIHKIAIYGGGNLGKLLYDELKIENKCIVNYIIDKQHVENDFGNLPIIKLQELDKAESVDAIIITPVYAAEKIIVELSKYSLKNIICIDEIICSLHNYK